MSKEKVDEILKKLEDGVAQLFESESYRVYLDTMTKFHHYSVNNCILISQQRPDASIVAGYTTWKKLHRHVVKGEKGITILSPAPYKRTMDVPVVDGDGKAVVDSSGHPLTEEKTEVKHYFKTATVFDVSQTDGEPLPSIVSDLVDPVDGYDDYLDAIREISPVPVRFDKIASGARGYYSPPKQEIVIQRGMAEEQTIKTLLHECAHARLGHGGEGCTVDRYTREVQAESVAYCCCKAFGIDTSDYSFGYVASWSSGRDTKELKRSLEIIREQSNQMIEELEQKMFLAMELKAQSLETETPAIRREGIRMVM